MLPRRIFLVSVINFLISFALEASLIFIPLLGENLGASDFQIGLIGAAYGGAYLVSSLYCGRQSDRWGRIGFIRLGLFLSALAFASQLLAKNFYILMLMRAGVGLTLGITTAALVAYAFELKADMGRYSSCGSLGWIAGSLIAVRLTEVQSLFLASMVISALAFFLSLLLHGEASSQSFNEKAEVKPYKDVIRRGFPIYLSVFLRHLGAAAVWIILPLYFTSQGLNLSWVGWLWSINFAVQFVVMRYLERFDPARIFAFGQVLSIFVFIAYAVVESLWLLVGAQMLLGAAWACLYVGALLLVLRAGEERGTASGIFQATLNLCSAVGPFLGGVIAQHWGYHGVMIFAAALGTAGFMTAIPRTKRNALEVCSRHYHG